MVSSKRLGCFGYRFMKVISRLSGSIIRNMKSWDVFLLFNPKLLLRAAGSLKNGY